MALSCETNSCNRTGLYLCRGCRGWFCVHFIGHAYLDCNAVAHPKEKRGTMVCWDCKKDGIE